MTQTKIEWADDVWNPVTGCTRVSPGCAHCYIERTPPFRMQGRRFTHGADGATTGVRLHPERLRQPLSWRKPRRVFVNSLSDLFHEDVPRDFIHDVFRTMERAEHHVFQVLTKRPDRALEVMRWLYTCSWCEGIGCAACDDHDAPLGMKEPLPNVWVGVSIENARFTWRADVLREIPAAVRFISAEPLLGSLYPKGDNDGIVTDASARGVPRAEVLLGGPRSLPLPGRTGLDGEASPPDPADPGDSVGAGESRRRAALDLTGIDWVIVGGESGPGARPMHPDWARDLRDACLAVCGECLTEDDYPLEGSMSPACGRPAFFFKQWGEWLPHEPDSQPPFWNGQDGTTIDGHAFPAGISDGADLGWRATYPDEEPVVWRRVGKKRAGRVLDGRTWDEMPASAAQPVSPTEGTES